MNKLDYNVLFYYLPVLDRKHPSFFFTVDWSQVGGAKFSNIRTPITEPFNDLTYWLLGAVLTVMNQYMK